MVLLGTTQDAAIRSNNLKQDESDMSQIVAVSSLSHTKSVAAWSSTIMPKRYNWTNFYKLEATKTTPLFDTNVQLRTNNATDIYNCRTGWIIRSQLCALRCIPRNLVPLDEYAPVLPFISLHYFDKSSTIREWLDMKRSLNDLVVNFRCITC